jgi:hypothetical protein
MGNHLAQLLMSKKGDANKHGQSEAWSTWTLFRSGVYFDVRGCTLRVIWSTLGGLHHATIIASDPEIDQRFFIDYKSPTRNNGTITYGRNHPARAQRLARSYKSDIRPHYTDYRCLLHHLMRVENCHSLPELGRCAKERSLRLSQLPMPLQ